MAEIPGEKLALMPAAHQPGTDRALAARQASLQEARTTVYRLSQVLEPHPTLEGAAEAFLRTLEGANRSAATISAYRADLQQFVSWLGENNAACYSPTQVQRIDIQEWLTALSRAGLSGVSRARKLAAVREYFRFLDAHDLLEKNPTTGIETPKKERKTRTYLSSDEYRLMLSEAAGSPRDYCLLQLFLQTGVRVSELCDIRLADIDLKEKTIKVRGKGNVERVIELGPKGLQAIKNYLPFREQVLMYSGNAEDHLFLTENTNPNKHANPLSVRMVQHLVLAYRKSAGISKKVTAHSLRHTFATYKAERNVSAFQLQQWLGHANLNTTQQYVHIGRANARKAMEQTEL